MKKFRLVLLLITVGFLAAGCQSGSGNGGGSDGEVEFEFWAAPNPAQEAFWEEMAEKYMEEEDNVSINVTPMPESPSSEAGIQSAIAAGNAPAISENISRGFAAQLAESSGIVPLNEFEGYDELIETREMEETMSSWQFTDDQQFVLPAYSNPMLFSWRTDILEDLGFDEAPRTFEEVVEVGETLKEEEPDKYLWARADLVKPNWSARWFDFFMLYNAASDGNNFVEANELVADEEAGIETFELFSEMAEGDMLLTREATDPFESGDTVMMDTGPWTFSYWDDKFPEMEQGETYELTMPPVPEDSDIENPKTFADTKGLSIYASATEEQQQAAFDFINWVYSNSENDLEWFEQTNLPPARDDLATNEAFTEFLDENPELQPYADNIPNAVPPIDSEQTAEIQELIGTEGLNPVVQGDKDAEQAWEDVMNAIDGVLE
ncbi:extracellular solute-binding protein [Halobacillus sp. A5]|uniref:extracellular solute-binding protein n=1 Tax=Halobacillus sp. A5 TaxID=2880263 RepID=UPI0020A62C9F|nr:extracellular solute-binding protein [Halobacillus sp. A5]MCP3027878.1 extracellular solute-binding protein [Halobacillus sp. A5]